MKLSNNRNNFFFDLIPQQDPSTMFGMNRGRSSFTLIELLVVLAIVAVLSVVVILTLNPAELIKQARDSNRLSDLATINTALNLFSTDVTGGFMGTSTIVYVSIPDSSPTCDNLGLPTLPTGYTYNCATTENLRNTDGTGWIPVNFQRISSNTPISQLPVDPTNTTTTRLYYTYTPGGSWELNATIEASKNKLGGSNDLVSKDGGSTPSVYELGNNLNLNPIEQGDPTLVGYWNFEEGPSATSTDRSGYGNHGRWYGASTAEQHYATGKVGIYSGSFDGSTDYVSCPGSGNLKLENNFTISAWVKFDQLKNYGYVVIKSSGGGNIGVNYRFMSQVDRINMLFGNGVSTNMVIAYYSSLGVVAGEWIMLTTTLDSGTLKIYGNSVLSASANRSISPVASDHNMTISASGNGVDGLIDDVRMYNRALSVGEIQALYNNTAR